MRIGYFLSSEEYTAEELIDQARLAEQAGFDALWISDHFHPWNSAQGQSTFVWSMIGAISQVSRLPVATAVTCPIIRQHPALVAQAAATCSVLTGERFTLGIGTGEALNEHVFGDPWPRHDIRIAMLEEAVGIIRELWAGGVVNHEGEHYVVEHAQLYSRPSQPPPILMSAFGPEAARSAGRVADGLITMGPNPAVLEEFRANGGENKPVCGGLKVCWGTDDDVCIDTAHRLWSSSGLPGELAQLLPTPEHFEQATSLVTRDMTAKSLAYGNETERHLDALRPYEEAGIDAIYVGQIGGNQPKTDYHGFFDFYRDQILPRFKESPS